MGLIELGLAVLAILAQPTPPPADFVREVLSCEIAVFDPGSFIGCAGDSEDDAPWAGLMWSDSDGIPGREARLETGP